METLWHPGVNPAADTVLFTVDPTQDFQICVLLIERGGTSGAQTHRWALPGGFVETSAPKGQPFVADRETMAEAAARELHEEAGILLSTNLLTPVGIYDDPARDPRNQAGVCQVVSHAWAAIVPWQSPQSGDDARAARWVRLDQLGSLNLAFDHAKIVNDAQDVIEKDLQVLRIVSSVTRDRADLPMRAQTPPPIFTLRPVTTAPDPATAHSPSTADFRP